MLFKDEYEFMEYAKEHLIKRGYTVHHVPRRRGKFYKNVGVGRLDLDCENGNLRFKIELKNPKIKIHQTKIQFSQLMTIFELREKDLQLLRF